MIQPSVGVFHDHHMVVPFGQTGVEYSWYNMMGELLAEGDTLYNVEEGNFLFQATNTYGCTSTWTWAFAFPGVQDLQRAIDWTWLSPTISRAQRPRGTMALHNALGQVSCGNNAWAARGVQNCRWLKATDGASVRLELSWAADRPPVPWCVKEM